MIIVCAWCGDTIKDDGVGDKKLSHGMCPTCYEEQQKEIQKYLKENNVK